MKEREERGFSMRPYTGSLTLWKAMASHDQILIMPSRRISSGMGSLMSPVLGIGIDPSPQRDDLHGHASWKASNMTLLTSSGVCWGCASRYFKTTWANCWELEVAGGQNCHSGGARYWPTEASPITMPAQIFPSLNSSVFAAWPSTSALQPRKTGSALKSPFGVG
jgi:hypothetical protein